MNDTFERGKAKVCYSENDEDTDASDVAEEEDEGWEFGVSVP